MNQNKKYISLSKLKVISILKSLNAVILVTLSLPACENEVVEAGIPKTIIPTQIILHGRKIDTVYLNSFYQDPGASYREDRDGIANCNDHIIVSDVKGGINTTFPGTYFLEYNAIDSSGNPLPTVTRTVHVVENEAGFLTGNYNVTCTCSASLKGSAQPTVTSGSYTAVVMPATVNNEFKIVGLNIGPERLVPSASLNGYSINVGFYGPDYTVNSSGWGTLSPSKNSFTIESSAWLFSPPIIYKCKNVYSKQLIEIARADK